MTSEPLMETVGFIGLGSMGAGTSSALLGYYSLLVHAWSRTQLPAACLITLRPEGSVQHTLWQRV